MKNKLIFKEGRKLLPPEFIINHLKFMIII
jgi:hypothetical protein